MEDSAFLKADHRLDTELVDKLILQLNRIYPQILTDKEATRVSLCSTEQTYISISVVLFKSIRTHSYSYYAINYTTCKIIA